MGEVQSVINFADYDIAIIKECDSEDLYKTSAYEANYLTTGDMIRLYFRTSDMDEATTIIANDRNVLVKRIELEITIADIEAFGKLPTVVNGIMCFESKASAEQFHDYMDSLFDLYDDSMDEILDLFESTYSGYKSYRTWFNEEYDWIDGSFTDKQLDDIYEAEVIVGEITKTFWNEDRMVTVGEETHFLYDEDTSISVDKNDQTSIDFLRDLEDGLDIYAFSLIVYSNAFKINKKKGGSAGNKAIFDIPGQNGSVHWASRPFLDDIECSVFDKKLRVSLDKGFQSGTDPSLFTYFGYIGQGVNTPTITLTIDWGDGTTQIVDDYVANRNLQESEVFHTYPSEGNFQITTSLSFLDGSISTSPIILEDTEMVDPDGDPNDIDDTMPMIARVNVSCTSEKNTQHPSLINGLHQLRGKIWVRDTCTGEQIGAYTHSWLDLDADGYFSRKKADLKVSIFGTFRNDQCEIEENKDGTRSRNNKEKCEKTKSKNRDKYSHLGNADVTSFHRMVLWGTTTQFNHDLIVCE